MSGQSALRVRDLSYAYAGTAPALDGVSFDVERGESVGVVGPNGAGKTTLFLCLGGVLGVRPGMIALSGLDPAEPDARRELPARVGLVFQNSDDQLFNATVLDDVAFGPLNLGLGAAEVRQRVTEALDEVGLSGFEERSPFHLSGGEKRRVALAGVLAMRPGVLLLDEPSMFLDPRGRRGLIGLIRQLPSTKLVSGHDLELIVETCERVLLLDHGRLHADGPVREVLSNETLLEQHGLEVLHSLRRR